MEHAELVRLKTKFENKRIEQATVKGQLDAQKKNLKEKWEVNSSGEAKAKIESINGELDAVAKEFDDGVEALKRDFASLLEG